VGKLLASPASWRRTLAVIAGGAHADASKAASKAVVPSMTARCRASSLVTRPSRALRARSSTIVEANAADASTVNRAIASKTGTATLPGARQYHLTVKSKRSWHNKSIDTDPHLQEAASPQKVVVRSFLRYVARESGVSASASSRGAAVDGPLQGPSSQILLSHTLRCRESA
jgi:hypothetical protein